jgi:hypothetical protein
MTANTVTTLKPLPSVPSEPALPAGLLPLVAGKSKARFTEDGDFVGDGEDGAWQPPATVTADQRREAAAAAQRIDLWLAPRPENRDYAAAQALGLLAQYWTKPLDKHLQAVVAQQWLRDIGDYPPDVIDRALDRWREVNQAAHNRPPLPGQVKALCEEVVAPRRRERERLLRLADPRTPAARRRAEPEPPAPLSPEERAEEIRRVDEIMGALRAKWAEAGAQAGRAGR